MSQETSRDIESPDAGHAPAAYRVPPAAYRFQKGQSGNPSGKPKKPKTAKDMVALARDVGPEMMQRLIKCARSDDDKVAFPAAVAVLDRAYGKPAQTVAHAVKDARSIAEFSTDELLNIITASRAGSQGTLPPQDGSTELDCVYEVYSP